MEHALTMGKLQTMRYSHKAMVDQILANPAISQGELARAFGYSESWVSNIMASDAFQSYFATRKAEVVDPGLLATVEENFRALVHRSQQVLMAKLALPQVPASVALKAMELGAKALRIGDSGGKAPLVDLDQLAGKLATLNQRTNPRRIIDGQVLSEASEGAPDA